jgi:malate dehydrogenase (oxaloacetate-decarboxylating)(NADP+)
MDIPVFHDDQHGTAIIAAAGHDQRLQPDRARHGRRRWCATARARPASPALELIKAMGVPKRQCHHVRHQGRDLQGRTEGMNQWKSAHAVETTARTLEEAMVGADVFMGLSAKGALTPEMVRSMAPADHLRHGQPRSGNHAGRSAWRARRRHRGHGRSDYPNQVNNVLGFPYIFRGALDVRATTINDGNENRRRQGAGGTGAGRRARRGGRRLSGARPRLGANTSFPCPSIRA